MHYSVIIGWNDHKVLPLRKLNHVCDCSNCNWSNFKIKIMNMNQNRKKSVSHTALGPILIKYMSNWGVWCVFSFILFLIFIWTVDFGVHI